MRPGVLAVVSLVSAGIGGGVALAAAIALGWHDADPVQTVVRPGETVTVEARPASAPPAAVARPLPGNDFDPAAIYAKRAAGVVTVYALFDEQAATGAGGQGSGFVVSAEGYILTNSHVITNAGEGPAGSATRAADSVYVEFTDGERVQARVVGWDVFDDVALLKVDPARHALAPVPLGDSSKVVVGEPVAAIGSPFGAEGSLAVGVVSATRRSIAALTSEYQLVDAIQTDAPINRGNSGGPLFDARGRVIGINAQIRSDSGLAEGVGFAVPVNAVKRSMAQLIEKGRVSYAYVGITTEDLTPAVARRLGLDTLRGALVATVRAGPGQEAGLRGGNRDILVQGVRVTVGGDAIVAIDGREVVSGEDLVRAVTNDLRPGQEAVFTVLRGGRRLEIPVRLAERPLTPGGD